MSWGYRIAFPPSARAEGAEGVSGYDKGVVTAGRMTPFLERVGGRARWSEARYGMTLYSGARGKLFWNAKRESLRSNETWARLMRMRIAVPIDAYVENAPLRSWRTGPAAWLPGLLNPAAGGGIVTITETLDGGGMPILLTQESALAWLDASQWSAADTLDLDRAAYDHADIFLSARLDVESKRQGPKAA